MFIEVDCETADKIIIQGLRESIECIKLDIDRLSAQRTLRPFEEEDLDYCTNMLNHLEAVYNYFGGDLQ